MLYANLNEIDLKDYQSLFKAIQYLKGTDYSNVADGRVVLDSQIYAQILSYETEDISKLEYEKHQKRLDLHYIVKGEETIYISSDTILKPVSEYDEGRDIQYIEDPRNVIAITLKPGDFVLIGLDEPHKTNGLVGGESDFVKKVVLKIAKDI